MQKRNTSEPSLRRRFGRALLRPRILVPSILALSAVALTHHPSRNAIDYVLPDVIENAVVYVIPKPDAEKTNINVQADCEPEIKAMSANAYNLSEQDRAALLVTAYFEAGYDKNLNEAKPYAIIGPMFVLLKRQASQECFGQYGSTVYEQALAPGQFSASEADYAAEQYEILRNYEGGEFDTSAMTDKDLVAKINGYIDGIVKRTIPDPTDGATFYRRDDREFYENNIPIPFGEGTHANSCGCLEQTVQLGDHLFFRTNPAACE